MKRINLAIMALLALAMASCGSSEQEEAAKEPTVAETMAGSQFAGHLFRFAKAEDRKTYGDALAASEKELGTKEGLTKEKLAERDAKLTAKREELNKKYVKEIWLAKLFVERIPGDIVGMTEKEIAERVKKEDEAAKGRETELAKKKELTDAEKAEAKNLRKLGEFVKQFPAEGVFLDKDGKYGAGFAAALGLSYNETVYDSSAIITEKVEGRFFTEKDAFCFVMSNYRQEAALIWDMDQYLGKDCDLIGAEKNPAAPVENGYGRLELTRITADAGQTKPAGGPAGGEQQQPQPDDQQGQGDEGQASGGAPTCQCLMDGQQCSCEPSKCDCEEKAQEAAHLKAMEAGAKAVQDSINSMMKKMSSHIW